mgnify:FL=1
MMMNQMRRGPGVRAAKCLSNALLGAVMAASAGPVAAASIEGSATDSAGSPLYRVAVCLKSADTGDDCIKQRFTDQKGQYRFSGVKPDMSYSVEIFADTSAAARKFEQYRTYVWEPQQRAAAVAGKNESVELQPFVGKFNFSNFQRVITLTGADFPELAGIDLQSDYVALKVFLPSVREGEAPETIFLGQVTRVDQLVIEASLPLAARAIAYEIYSASMSLSGSIAVAEG